eukprot:3078359-Amphidinium_carterae.1
MIRTSGNYYPIERSICLEECAWFLPPEELVQVLLSRHASHRQGATKKYVRTIRLPSRVAHLSVHPLGTDFLLGIHFTTSMLVATTCHDTSGHRQNHGRIINGGKSNGTFESNRH